MLFCSDGAKKIIIAQLLKAVGRFTYEIGQLTLPPKRRIREIKEEEGRMPQNLL